MFQTSTQRASIGRPI